jgi:hypothetical protein
MNTTLFFLIDLRCFEPAQKSILESRTVYHPAIILNMTESLN